MHLEKGQANNDAVLRGQMLGQLLVAGRRPPWQTRQGLVMVAQQTDQNKPKANQHDYKSTQKQIWE